MKKTIWLFVLLLLPLTGGHTQTPPAPPTNLSQSEIDNAIKNLKKLDVMKIGDRVAIGDNVVKKVSTLTEANVIPNAFLGGMMFKVFVYVDGKHEATLGGHTIDDAKKVLKMVGMKYANGKQKVRVAIYDPHRGWTHPGGKEMPVEWDGFLDLELKVQVGSWSE